MTSRNAYIALTPEGSAFRLAHTEHAPDSPQSSSSSDLSSSSTSHPQSRGSFQILPIPRSPSPEPGFLEESAVGDDPGARCQWKSGIRYTLDVLENNTGLLLVAGSQAFLSVVNVLVKKITSIEPPVTALELVIVRMAITGICSVLYMFWAKVPDPLLGPKGVRLLLAFRGFTGFFGVFGMYYSLQYLSLSDATVLTFLAPMCTAVVGALVLKETFTLKEALAGICSLIGVVLIARPQFLFGQGSEASPTIDNDMPGDVSERGTPSERLVAVGVALIGVLGATGAYTSLRAIGKRAHPLHSMVSFSVQCVIAASVGMIVLRVPVVIPTRLDWLLMLLMIGLFGFIAQVLLTMGLQRETAGRGTLAVYLQIVFATILERIFFHSTPSILSIIGTIIIMTSAIYVALTKERTKKTSSKNISLARVDHASLEEGLLDSTELEETKSKHGSQVPYEIPPLESRSAGPSQEGQREEHYEVSKGIQTSCH